MNILNNKKTERLGIRLTPALKKKLLLAAIVNKTSMSQIMRELLESDTIANERKNE